MKRITMNVLVAAVLFTCLGAVQIQQPPRAVDLAEDPSYSLVLENEFVRVFRAEIPRLKQTALHSHSRDFVMLTLGDGLASFAQPGFAPMTREFYDGYVQFVSGGFSHVVKNEDTVSTFRAFVIELKQGRVKPGVVYDYLSATAQLYDSIPLPVDPRASYTVSHEAESVIGSDLQLVPGDSTPMHQHRGPHLAFALTDMELESTPESGAGKVMKLARGEVAWIPAGAPHRLKNVGRTPARFITLEMK